MMVDPEYLLDLILVSRDPNPEVDKVRKEVCDILYEGLYGDGHDAEGAADKATELMVAAKKQHGDDAMWNVAYAVHGVTALIYAGRHAYEAALGLKGRP